MLLTEWNWDDFLEVRTAESREEGREEGRVEGRVEGREENREETARKALSEGISIELIHKITGLDIDKIKTLQEK